ncbi:MAG: NAD-dependent epimerase/dehydratase family protein [Deltaproteobacteria bacterium]|nr:MAG: NAD-dependent epimerase/dehydratase family protein [Deltaproteobacteria bacterium]
MATFMTGGTGYLGGYTLLEHLDRSDETVFLLVRGRDHAHRVEKLWNCLQLHIDAERFRAVLDRVVLVGGDLHAPELGLAPADRERVLSECTRIFHGAASLNRMSSRVCVNSNVRGTISTLELARALHERGRLRRYTFVSTAAVVGDRKDEHLQEDDSLDFGVNALDPYSETKRVCEEMVQRLLPADVSRVIFRPATVVGDSRHPRTTSFEMPSAFVWLANLPVVPMSPDIQFDVVNADWVGKAMAAIHLDPSPKHVIYFLSAGKASPTTREIGEALAEHGFRKLRFAPHLQQGFFAASRAGSRLPRGNPLQGASVLLKVFWPYIVSNVTHDNQRAVAASAAQPAHFVDYGGAHIAWVKERGFKYPYVPLPAGFSEAA